VIMLAEHFVKVYSAEFKKSIQGISDELKERLLKHNWPGNVRELKNTIERAVLFEQGNVLFGRSIVFAEADEQKYSTLNKIEFSDQCISLYDIERKLIIQALQKANYNQTKAAKLLGITRETLKYRQKKYNITY